MNAMYNIFFQQQIYFYLKYFHDLKNLPPSRRKQSSYLGEIQSIKGTSAQVMFFVKWYVSLLYCYNVASDIHVNAEAMKSISREISFHQYMGMIFFLEDIWTCVAPSEGLAPTCEITQSFIIFSFAHDPFESQNNSDDNHRNQVTSFLLNTLSLTSGQWNKNNEVSSTDSLRQRHIETRRVFP